MRSCFKCNTYERNNILLYLKCCKGGEKREFKNKGERERYTHLNAEFQRTVRKDKKAFLSEKCKEIEENNRIGKTTKGTFHTKMGMIKDKYDMDLSEAEDIKRKLQEHTKN